MEPVSDQNTSVEFRSSRKDKKTTSKTILPIEEYRSELKKIIPKEVFEFDAFRICFFIMTLSLALMPPLVTTAFILEWYQFAFIAIGWGIANGYLFLATHELLHGGLVKKNGLKIY